ncbi:MAG: serine hydrolase [Acidobacteriaceae bacterium]
MVVLAGLMALAGVARAQTTPHRNEDKALESKLQALAATQHGKVALYAENLKTGDFVGLDADKPVQTASVIKLTILYEAMEEVRAGKAKWDEKITLHQDDKVLGSGILHFFDAPLTLTLKDALTMMVIVSDNTATNMMIDRFGLDNINARIAWLGLHNTHLYKKISKPATEPMPADQPQFGLGKTTAREMATVMEKIGRCELADHGTKAVPEDKPICAVALHMLQNQFYRDDIPRYLEALDTSESVSAIANKTGALNAVRNDVAIVAGKTGPIIISSFTYDNADHSWTADNEGELMNARLARDIVQAWSPQGLDGSILVPGLGLGQP